MVQDGAVLASNARRDRQWARGILGAASLQRSPSAKEVVKAKEKLHSHHGTAMPQQYEADTGRHSPDAWLCHTCSLDVGREVWVRPSKPQCFTCGKNKPRSCRKFGRRDQGRGGGKGDEGQKRKPRDGSDKPKEKDEASIAKAAYEDCKRAFGGDEGHFAVKKFHARWQELLTKGGGGKGSESKEVREIESQLRFLRGMEGEEAKKEREVLEGKLAVAKAKSPYKSPSAELRAAEAKRAAAAKASKKAQDETEAIVVAK